MSTTAALDIVHSGGVAVGSPLLGTRAYDGGELVASGFTIDELSTYLSRADPVVWTGLAADTAGPLLQELAEQLGFDELSVKDAVSRHERPKVDHYPDYVFLNAYLTQLETGSGRLVLSQVSALVAAKIIITVHAAPFLALEDHLERR